MHVPLFSWTGAAPVPGVKRLMWPIATPAALLEAVQ
jgi:hypothetical protein